MLGVFIKKFLKLLQTIYHIVLSTFKSIILEITFEECGAVLLIYSYLFQLIVILEND
jgi:hypothetical protein